MNSAKSAKFLTSLVFIVLFLISVAFWDGMVLLAYNRLCDLDAGHSSIYNWGGAILCAVGGFLIGFLFTKPFIKTMKAFDVGSEAE